MRVLAVICPPFGVDGLEGLTTQTRQKLGLAAPHASIEVATLQTGEQGFADGGPPARGQVHIDGAALLAPALPFGRRAQGHPAGSSAPLGAAIAAALAADPAPTRLVVGLADSACHDAGAGMLAAWARAIRCSQDTGQNSRSGHPAGTAHGTAACAGALWESAPRGEAAHHGDAVPCGDSAAESDAGAIGATGSAEVAPADPRILQGDSLAQDFTEVAAAMSGRTLTVAYADDASLTGLHGISHRLVERRNLAEAEAADAELRLSSIADSLLAARTAAGLAGGLPGIGPPASWPGSGAGGGAAMALAALGARLQPGASWWARESGLAGRLAAADIVLVVTDRLDWRIADTALPVIAALSAERALPIVALARSGMLTRTEQAAAGLAGSYVADAGDDAWLAAVVPRLARTWLR